MKSLLASLLLTATFLSAGACAETPKAKVLIVDGQNNHKWAETTPLLKAILENTGRFSVEVSTTPPAPAKPKPLPKNATPEQRAAYQEAVKASEAQAEAYKAKTQELWGTWHPRFADYDVVISNYNGENWPKEMQEALLAFVRNGGGFVSYHAADNSFADWPEYNEMIGLGGWGGRTEKAGPYLRLRDGAWIKVQAPGPCGGHGAREEFLVETIAPGHPIMHGLPAKWMHSQDELYHSLRGPADGVTVLASATSPITKESEPMLMTLSFGKGRVFHTTLGHYVEALSGLGFQTTFVRGTEWAATGKVTLPAPKPDELPEGPKAAVRDPLVKAPVQ